MTVDPQTLSSMAIDYTKDMTSIRGRRVQKLLKREFAGAECVVRAELADGNAAVLGLSESGAAICATDGTGKQASVVKWVHGSDTAFETRFDLHKDSLPVLSSTTLPISQLHTKALRVSASSVPSRARTWLSEALEVLG